MVADGVEGEKEAQEYDEGRDARNNSGKMRPIRYRLALELAVVVKEFG